MAFLSLQQNKGGIYHRQLVGMLAFGFCNKKKSNQIKSNQNQTIDASLGLSRVFLLSPSENELIPDLYFFKQKINALKSDVWPVLCRRGVNQGNKMLGMPGVYFRAFFRLSSYVPFVLYICMYLYAQ